MQVLGDFTTTVIKAFDEIDPDWRSYDGLVVCGTHTPKVRVDRDEKDNPATVGGMLLAIQEAREKRKPFLGICFGHQLAAIEYARNVLGDLTATSEEIETGSGLNYVVKKRPGGLKVGLRDGETYWNNYEVIPELLEIWKKADNFMTVQYHPEYQSSKDNPHPLLKNFLSICKNNGNVVGRRH